MEKRGKARRPGKKKLLELYERAARVARIRGIPNHIAYDFAGWCVERWINGLSRHQLMHHSLYDWFDSQKHLKREQLYVCHGATGEESKASEMLAFFENRAEERPTRWVPTRKQLDTVPWFRTRNGRIYLLVVSEEYLQREVADMFGITESRVCQIIAHGRAVLQWMIDNETTRTPTRRELGKNKFGK